MSHDTDVLSLTLPKRSKSRRKLPRPPKNVVLWLLLCGMAAGFMLWDLLDSDYIAAGVQAFFFACFWRNVTRGLDGLGPKLMNGYVVAGVIFVQLVLSLFGVY